MAADFVLVCFSLSSDINGVFWIFPSQALHNRYCLASGESSKALAISDHHWLELCPISLWDGAHPQNLGLRLELEDQANAV